MRLALLVALVAFPLFGEIESVVIGYREQNCNTEQCIRVIKERFKVVPDIAEVNVSPGAINLTWKPNRPFTFEKINIPLRLVGLSPQNVAVTARGLIKQEGDKLYLVSLGDNTKFQLLNPPQPKSNDYIEYNNIDNYTLLPHVRKQLEEAMKSKQVVQASGWLLGPWRYNLALVMTNLSTEKESNTTIRGGNIQNQ